MRVAILEDDKSVADHIGRLMTAAGHTSVEFQDGAALLKGFRRESFDLVLLDWNLPDTTGIEVLAWAKGNLIPPPPTIMITARNSERDVVAGLTSGADDYVTKPFRDVVLQARVAAVLRRAYRSDPKSGVEIFGNYTFSIRELTVTVGKSTVTTTPKEFGLALALFRNLGRPLSRQWMMDAVWGLGRDSSGRTLDAHISQIRRRLSLRPEHGLRLSSVYGYGYRLEEVDLHDEQIAARSE
jgi:DNA-binding response OmpR family regulator